MSDPTSAGPGAEQLAELFHEIYERRAPEFGYTTRSDTRRFDRGSHNGKLMIAVCDDILTWLDQRALRKLSAERDQATAIVGELAALVRLDKTIEATRTGATLIQYFKDLTAERDFYREAEQDKAEQLPPIAAERNRLKAALKELLWAWDWMHPTGTAYDGVEARVLLARKTLAGVTSDERLPDETVAREGCEVGARITPNTTRTADETTPARPFAWYRQSITGCELFARGDWPPPEPDDTAWLPLYRHPEVESSERK